MAGLLDALFQGQAPAGLLGGGGGGLADTLSPGRARRRQEEIRKELINRQLMDSMGLEREKFGLQKDSNELARQRFEWEKKNSVPAQLKMIDALGIPRDSLEARRALFPRQDTQMPAADKKAIMAAEDDIPRLNATMRNVQDAMKLNPQVYEGMGASLRGTLGAKLPDWMVPDFVADPKRGKATTEWDQLMGQEAIKMMSETLKGASTDFEMKKFLGIAADTSQPQDVRKRAMERFINLAGEELSLRKRRVNELKAGTYYKPGGGQQPASDGWSVQKVD
jgi:hypothetical protein